MKKFTYIIFALLTIVTLNSCEDKVEALETNYIAFGNELYSTGVDVDGTASIVVPVYTANLSGSDRTFSLSVDPASNAATSSYTLPTSVTIPANENSTNFTVVLSDTDLGIGVSNLIINFENEIGLSTGAPTKISYSQNCTEVTATLEINFDAWASESSWSITDSLGGVIASKAAKSYADGQASATETIILCAGRDYTFTFNDSYGDGLSDPTDGNLTLTVNGVEKGAATGAFGSKYEVAFDTK